MGAKTGWRELIGGNLLTEETWEWCTTVFYQTDACFHSTVDTGYQVMR